MKLIHTSDWHLGQLLHGQSRELEHARFLSWLLATLCTREVDVLLVTGDIFDSANPPSSAQRQYYQFLASARAAAPRLQIVVIAGNHDSGARLDAPLELLHALDVHVVGALRGTDASAIALKNSKRETAAWLVAVPFLRPSDFPIATGSSVAGTAALYAERIDFARALCTADQALLACGHCYMVGGMLSSLSERDIQRGHQDALPVDIFPTDLAYVALGHLHRAQAIGGREAVRYSGSPLPLSMIERDYVHQVLLVEFAGRNVRSIESIVVPRARDIILLPATHAPLEQVLSALKALPRTATSDLKPLLEVRVQLDSPQVRLRAQLLEALGDAWAELVNISVRYPERTELEPSPARLPTELSPLELFDLAYRARFNDPAPLELRALFSDALQAATP